MYPVILKSITCVFKSAQLFDDGSWWWVSYILVPRSVPGTDAEAEAGVPGSPPPSPPPHLARGDDSPSGGLGKDVLVLILPVNLWYSDAMSTIRLQKKLKRKRITCRVRQVQVFLVIRLDEALVGGRDQKKNCSGFTSRTFSLDAAPTQFPHFPTTWCVTGTETDPRTLRTPPHDPDPKQPEEAQRDPGSLLHHPRGRRRKWPLTKAQGPAALCLYAQREADAPKLPHATEPALH